MATVLGAGPSTGENKLRKALLKDIGPKLPLGILDPAGAYAKDIVTRPWRMKEERELGTLRDANRDANVAQFVSMVLGTMCTKIGQHDLEPMKPTERRVIVSQMFMGDVFYAYIWLRVQALGAELVMNMTCPSCAGKFPYTADLNTVEVTTAEKLEDATWEYALKTPFTLRSEKVNKLLLGPARWNGLEMMGSQGALNTGAAKAGIIRNSIHAVPGKDGKMSPIALADSELDEMSKRDIEEITSQIDKHAVGPNMAIDDKCPRCRYAFKLPIDWGYDGFFGASGP